MSQWPCIHTLSQLFIALSLVGVFVPSDRTVLVTWSCLMLRAFIKAQAGSQHTKFWTSPVPIITHEVHGGFGCMCVVPSGVAEMCPPHIPQKKST